jgi:hypothetical protein
MEQKLQKKSSTKLEQTRQQGVKTLIVLLVVGAAVFLAYSPLFGQIDGGSFAGKVIGSTFAAIFAILMTMFLLNKQTEIEQESKKSERVFDEKVVLYKDILERAKNMLEDGQIDSKEFLALPFTMIKMQMIGGDEAIQIYTEFFEKINEIFEADENDIVQIPDSQVQQVFSLLSRFSVQCRVDLGISDTPIDESIFARTISAVEQSSEAVKGKRDTSKYTFNGEALAKSRLVHAVVKDYVSKNPNTTYDDLKKAFPDEWQAGGSKSSNRAVFVRLIEAEKLFKDKGHRRHFFKEGETVQLSDEIIAVSNQWGIGNIDDFVNGSNQNHNANISK